MMDDSGKPVRLNNFDIDFKNVTFGYNESAVIKNMSFHIPQHSMTALVGKSGCGKTTLLKVISGLEERDAGEISFFDEAGRPVSSPKLSLVFQDPRLLPWKTVEENLSLAIRYLPEQERKQRIREVLELVTKHRVQFMQFLCTILNLLQGHSHLVS
mgnify:CR=1 FL=1